MSDSSGKAEAVITERVRITETDPYGIAHHSCYAVWAEMGLRALLRKTGGSENQEIVSFDCKYLRSALADDEIQIRTRAVSGNMYRFEIMKDRMALAQGTLITGQEGRE